VNLDYRSQNPTFVDAASNPTFARDPASGSIFVVWPAYFPARPELTKSAGSKAPAKCDPAAAGQIILRYVAEMSQI
jgi:hypothetical protein